MHKVDEVGSCCRRHRERRTLLHRGLKTCFCACSSLENAGVTADDVNYINAHATSTPAGDMAEYRAIRAAIPSSHVRINGTKSMIGHLLGAAGAVEAVATVQAIRTGRGYRSARASLAQEFRGTGACHATTGDLEELCSISTCQGVRAAASRMSSSH